MNLQCPHCGTAIAISGVQAGAQVKCGACAQVFLMPQQQPVQQSPISSHAPQTSHTSGKKLESCGACGNLVARTATKCLQCGARTKSGSINDLVRAFVIIIVVLGAILFGVKYYFPNELIF